ncbi:MAG: hypothetical protein OSB41_07125 [Kiritimatiellae bacterium]|nr:hypothetical protein [Kiritimatiellia bacterium]
MRVRRILILLGTATVSLVGGFYVGAKMGAEYSRDGMAPFRAFLAYSDINRIRGGKSDIVLITKEIDIDNELYFWGKYIQHEQVLGDLLFPGHAYDRDKFIRAVVKYRLENPHDDGTPLEKSADDTKGKGHAPESGYGITSERRRIISDVLSKYSDRAVSAPESRTTQK